MSKEKIVDYSQVMRDFDKSQGRKPDDFDISLRSSSEPDGGVDYLVASREWSKHLASDQAVVRNEGKK